MTKLVLVFLAVVATVVLAQGGDYEHFFGGPNPGGDPSYAGSPNQNRGSGPILFPNSPPGGETSGVIVGASGYGFVPPRSGSIGIPHYGGISAGPSYSGFF